MSTEIEDAEARVAEAQKHLLDAQRQLTNIKIARNASCDRLGILPLEIVSRIFETYVDEHFAYIHTQAPFSRHCMEPAPLLLGAICHAWRTIAWALPRLWNRISVNIHVGERRAIPEIAMQWLERSGQLPLSIGLYEDTNGDNIITDTVDIISLIRAICMFSSRWETFDLSIVDDTLDQVVCEYWNPGLNAQNWTLRHLQLRSLSPRLTEELFNNVPSKPSPVCVVLSKIDTSALYIDWSNVTTIYAFSLTLQHSLNIFGVSPCLQDVTFCSFGLGEPALSPMSIICPTLRSLTIKVEDASHSKMILDSLTLKSLNCLRYLNPGPSSQIIDNIMSFIARSHCQLTKLKLCNFRINDELVRLLRETSSLEVLNVDDHQHTGAERLFKCLAKTTARKLTFLPRLTMLKAYVRLHPSFSWKIVPGIFDPVQSFTGQGCPSKKPEGLQRQCLQLNLEMIGNLEEDCYIDSIPLHRISNLVEQGIPISIKHREIRTSDCSHDLVASSLIYHQPYSESGVGYESV